MAVRRPSAKKLVKMDMGMMAAPSPNTQLVKIGALIDPSSPVWGNMSRANQEKYYTTAVKRTNRRIAELKERKEEDTFIYRALEKAGQIIPKSGSVGFSTAGYKDWGYPKLKKEYEKVYRTYKQVSLKEATKKYAEKNADRFASVGIDWEEIESNPEIYEDLLSNYWYLWQALEDIGFWKKAGLYSYESQRVLREYVESGGKLTQAKKDYDLNDPNKIIKTTTKRVATSIMRKFDETTADAGKFAAAYTGNQERDSRAHDAYMQNKLLLDYDKRKMTSIRDSLLAKVASEMYGTTPIEEAFSVIEDGEENEAYLK